MLKFDYDVSTVFIMLGNKCNMNCKYCLQNYSYEKPLPAQKINPDIINFIKNISNSQTKYLDVRFYGGEPLVYWETVKNMINQLKDENIIFSMISNGKLIDEEKAIFLNNNNVCVSISYDGRNVLKTRRYDVIKENEKPLLILNSMGINSVLTPYCMPYTYVTSLIDINKKYYDIHKHGIGITQELIFDIAGVFTDLIDFDYDLLKKECELLSNSAEKIVKKIANNEQTNINEQLILRYITSLLSPFLSDGIVYGKASCGNATSVINIDTEGNIYRCHNDNVKLSTIYDSLENYKKVFSVNDNIIRNFLNNDCSDCDVVDYCQGGCPLIEKTSRDKSGYCTLRKTLYKEYRKIANILLNIKP